MSRLEPVADNLVVKMLDGDDKSKGGLLLPAGARDQEKSAKGEVVAVGPGKWVGDRWHDAPADIGDKVVFMKFAGIDTVIGGEMFRLLPFDAIVAKIV